MCLVYFFSALRSHFYLLFRSTLAPTSFPLDISEFGDCICGLKAMIARFKIAFYYFLLYALVNCYLHPHPSDDTVSPFSLYYRNYHLFPIVNRVIPIRRWLKLSIVMYSSLKWFYLTKYIFIYLYVCICFGVLSADFNFISF